MKIAFPKQVIPHGVVIAVVAVGLFMTLDWPQETALFPEAAGITAIVVALIAIFMEMRQAQRQGNKDSLVWTLPSHLNHKAVGDFLALAGFIFGIWFLGYVPSAILFLFLHIKWRGKQTWLISILVAAGAFAFMQLIFGMLLDIKWFTGALWKMLDL